MRPGRLFIACSPRPLVHRAFRPGVRCQSANAVAQILSGSREIGSHDGAERCWWIFCGFEGGFYRRTLLFFALHWRKLRAPDRRVLESR